MSNDVVHIDRTLPLIIALLVAPLIGLDLSLLLGDGGTIIVFALLGALNLAAATGVVLAVKARQQRAQERTQLCALIGHSASNPSADDHALTNSALIAQCSAELEALQNQRTTLVSLSRSAAAALESASTDALRTWSEKESRLQQTRAAIEQINSGSREIVDLVGMISDSTSETSSSINNAATKVNHTCDEIDAQTKRLDAVENTLQMVGSQVTEIAGFLSVIEEIADQTNLLALNAAIEAARAGDQGRGFAVVADEVRSLAKKTRNATDSITHKIEGLHRSSAETSELMNHARDALQNSSAEVQSIGEVMEEINAAFGIVDEMMSNVVNACEQEFGSINQIMETMSSAELNQKPSGLTDVLADLQQMQQFPTSNSRS